MLIEKLYLQNFLSYKKEFIEFDDGLNILKGNNASGKTNLVEAIFLSSIGKTARNTKDKDLINWNSDNNARIKLLVKKKYYSHTIEIFIDKNGKKTILIDSIPISRLGELLGILNVVFFSPDEMKLIKNSPADRRRFIDISLSQQNKIYFYNLLKYNKLLQQRNKVLKNYKNNNSLKDMLEIVDKSLIPCEENIIIERSKFIEKLRPVANDIHKKITDQKEHLNIAYETESIDFSDISSSLKKLYISSYEKDKKLEYTTVGIHRDDLKIETSNIDVRKYGSQGQQRTAVLSLKLAEIKMLETITGETPILLLDDVMSELDERRQKALMNAIQGIQTIITCTDFNKNLVNYDFTRFTIKDKHIIEKERIRHAE